MDICWTGKQKQIGLPASTTAFAPSLLAALCLPLWSKSDSCYFEWREIGSAAVYLLGMMSTVVVLAEEHQARKAQEVGSAFLPGNARRRVRLLWLSWEEAKPAGKGSGRQRRRNN